MPKGVTPNAIRQRVQKIKIKAKALIAGDDVEIKVNESTGGALGETTPKRTVGKSGKRVAADSPDDDEDKGASGKKRKSVAGKPITPVSQVAKAKATKQARKSSVELEEDEELVVDDKLRVKQEIDAEEQARMELDGTIEDDEYGI